MADRAEITDLIGEIYDAALDPALWPRVLERIVGGADASAAMISEAGLDLDRLYTSVEIDPAFSEIHAKHALRMSPVIGTMSGDSRELLRRLAPHFRRAAAISRALERNESKAAAFADVLDRLRSAVVFVDRAGRLVHANEPAAHALALREGLVWNEGKPRPQDARAAAHLESILAMSGSNGAASGPRVLSVTITAAAGELLTVHVITLSRSSRRRPAPAAAVAAILVSRGASDIPQRVQSAANLYAFTPAESRVAQALLGGGTVGSLARTLGISEATVKTHLQHIFDKTGTRRRADLVQLIAGFGAP